MPARFNPTRLFAILKRNQAEFEQQGRELKACRQRLAQAESRALAGRVLTGLAHHLATPLAFSKSNVFMAIQALDDLLPALRAASNLLEAETVGAGNGSVPRSPEFDPATIRTRLTRCPDDINITQDLLADVLMGLDQMELLVNNLRVFTQLDRTRTEAVNLKAVLHNVASIARAAMPSNVKVVESGSELPPLECDVSQLNHAFLNVILHAAQGIEGAGVISLTTSTDAQHIRVRIEDSGGGLPDPVLQHLFDPDFCAPATGSGSGSGSGPGLSSARDVVSGLGGSISVESRPGMGTSVQIDIPLNIPASR